MLLLQRGSWRVHCFHSTCSHTFMLCVLANRTIELAACPGCVLPWPSGSWDGQNTHDTQFSVTTILIVLPELFSTAATNSPTSNSHSIASRCKLIRCKLSRSNHFPQEACIFSSARLEDVLINHWVFFHSQILKVNISASATATLKLDVC